MPQSQLMLFAQRITAYITGMRENDAVQGVENEGFFVRNRGPGETVNPRDFRRINIWVRDGIILKAIAG